jgi:hypothetical protein
MDFKTTFFFNFAHPPLFLLLISSPHMKNKHGSIVRITLGTVIIFNILQHYSISITTLIVYFTHYSILLFFISRSCTFTFCIFTSICAHLVHVSHFNLLLLYFSYSFFVAFHYRSTTTLPFTFPVFINNLTLIATGCEDENIHKYLQQQNQAKLLSKNYQNIGACQKYQHIHKILALAQNIGACSKYRRFLKILALAQNIGAFSKYRRISKICSNYRCQSCAEL